jgi:hypothetical protein
VSIGVPIDVDVCNAHGDGVGYIYAFEWLGVLTRVFDSLRPRYVWIVQMKMFRKFSFEVVGV